MFNDVAGHDIYWGANSVPYDTRSISHPRWHAPGIRHILLKGLKAIMPFLHAEAYEDRYRLCEAQYLPPRHIPLVLFAGLRSPHEYSPDMHRPIPPRASYDLDDGPEDIWVWAHEGSSRDRLRQGHEIEIASLRERAFVMWDKSRLEALGWLDETWEQYAAENIRHDPEDPASNGAGGLPGEQEPKLSWLWRKRILALGGSGYWSVHDDSQVIWNSTRPDDYAPLPEDVDEMHRLDNASFGSSVACILYRGRHRYRHRRP